jgi:hypothetical protein
MMQLGVVPNYAQHRDGLWAFSCLAIQGGHDDNAQEASTDTSESYEYTSTRTCCYE